jgi:hypothetical protein
MTQKDWEIPAYEFMKALDQSDFMENGQFSPPLYMWESSVVGMPIIRLSGIDDANETIDLESSQDVDDLIKRLERARKTVFGESK